MFYCDWCADQREWPRTGYKSYGSCDICGLGTECNDRPARLLPIPNAMQLLEIEQRRTRIEHLQAPDRGNCLVSGLTLNEVIATVKQAGLNPSEWVIDTGHGVEGEGAYLQEKLD